MAATYTPIATTTASGSSSTITFSSISGSYTDLILVINAKGGAGANLRMRFNSDTGTNYSRTYVSGTGSSALSSRTSNFSSIPLDAYATLNSTDFAFNEIVHIMNYANTTTYKTVLVRTNNASSGTDASVGLWRSTSAITAFSVFTNDSSNFSSGSTFTIYGILAA